MENKEQQILSEIKSMMASIRSQLERLDAKMAELQQIVDPEELEASPIDIDIDIEEDAPVVETEPVEVVQTVEVQEIPMEVEEESVEAPVEDDDDLPFAETPAETPAEIPVETPVETPVEVSEEVSEESVEVPEEEAAEVAETPVETPVEAPAEDDDDLPGVFDLPEAPVTVAAKAADQAKPILNEVMASDCAWRKDMPGTQVRDIRSAISLNDRVIFINLLFKEDAQTFVDTLSKINTMETLDQVVEHICATFPDWDLNSDLVYRFMMAVRRKVK